MRLGNDSPQALASSLEAIAQRAILPREVRR
jgi:hypothetical protein